jgi:hypothetical protein
MRDYWHLDLGRRRHAVAEPAKIVALVRAPHPDSDSKRISAKTDCLLRRRDQLTNAVIRSEHARLNDQTRLSSKLSPQLLGSTRQHRYRIRLSAHHAVKCLREIAQSSGTNVAISDEVVNSDTEKPSGWMREQPA